MALYDEADFIFIVPVFSIKFGEHRIKARSLRIDVDHVGGDVAAEGFQFVNFPCVGLQNVFGGSVRLDWALRRPIIVANAAIAQILRY